MTTVHVWLVPVAAGAGDDPALSAAERSQIGSLGLAADRDRAATARLAARLLTGGMAAVNWSHSGAWVALAAAPDRPVGVDIEEIPAVVPLDALALLGLDSMDGFVAREAAGKALGIGLTEQQPDGVTVHRLAAPVGYVGAVAAPGDDWTVSCQVTARRFRPALRDWTT